MRQFFIKTKKILPLLLIGAAVIILYHPVLFTYFSQDDFFHFKVSLTDGSIDQFIKLFGFHPFSERGIAFYRPMFRELIFNSFYNIFGLNHFPFRILQLVLLFLNSFLAYTLIKKMFKDKYLASFVAFFYAICSAQISSLYYLAGGIQVLGATTFLLLTLILALKRSFLSFIAFLFAIASHELASVIPLLICGILFVQYPFKKALGKIWQVLPFFSILIIYLYLEINTIGFSSAEKQYQINFSLKTILNSYMWYFGWALGLPEMLIDFVFPNFKLNPTLMRYWGNYYSIIFPSFFVTLILLTLSILYLAVREKRIFLDKKVIFMIVWFIVGLIPVILLPLHKSTQYLETGLVAFWTLVGVVTFNFSKLGGKFAKVYISILIVSLLTLSVTSILLQRTTYWAAQRGKYAKQLINQVTSTYPTLPKGAILYFENDPNYPFVASDWGSSSKQASFILNNQDVLRLIYNDPTLQVFYEDLSKPTPSGKNIYSIIAKIY